MQPLQPENSRPSLDSGLTPPRGNFRQDQISHDVASGEKVVGTNRRDLHRALDDAWKVISDAGYTRFGSVARLRPLEFADQVKATNPDLAQPLSVALDIIAWHQFNQLEGAPDKAVQFLQRANLLSPHSSAILYHLADSTLFLNDGHLSRITDPEIRRMTLQGYRGSTQDTILHTLATAFGIFENDIRGRTATALESRVDALSVDDRTLAFDLLGKLAALCNLSGTDREKLGLLNLSIAASSCQLAILGHGRDLRVIVSNFIEQLGECETTADIDTFLQNKSPRILDIFCQLASTTWNKGNILSAHLKHVPDQNTRLSMEKDFTLMHCLSEDIDAILDLVEPLR
jgi:hypothetical protein